MPIWNIPFARNPFFTGQENVLSQLASLLQSEQKTALTQPQAINGLGGIGKTQLALEYAYRHRQDYHAILWGLADTREALISTFVNIAALLDLPEKDEKDQMVIVEAVKTWLKDRSTWLLILDNADELALVKEFLPLAFRGHLLLTTRAQAMGGLARKLEMKVMLPEVGALLLLRRSGRLVREAPLVQASSLEILEAKALSQELGGLPLALDQAGAYMEETQCRLGEYRELYRMRRADLFKTRGSMADNHPEPVATTWSLSFQRVEKKNTAAANLLRLCAFLTPDAIPEEILIKGAEHLGPVLAPVVADAFLLKQAIATLRAYSLIDRDPQTRALTIHRLVQAVLLDNMSAEEQQEWRHRIAHAATTSFPSLRALAIWEQQLGASHPETATSLNNLAITYYTQGKYEEVEPLLKQALARNEQQLGASHPNIVTNLNNLAALYCDQGRYEEAEPLYQRALTICEQQLGASHPNMTPHRNPAWQISGRETDLFVLGGLPGESAHRRGYVIRVSTNIIAGLNNLATLYCDQGKYEEAEPLYQRALTICEQQLGASHPNIVTNLNNLATLYYMQGKYAEAEPLYQHALVICKQELGAEHPDTQGIRKNYTLLLQAMSHDGKRGIWKRVLERFFQ